MPDPTPDEILAEIRLMARADHAYRMDAGRNPYPLGSDRAIAWDDGWNAEDQAEHRLDEEMAKLPYFRVRTSIVAGGETLAEIDRADWPKFGVAGATPNGREGMFFHSRDAAALFPDRDKVAIRVDYERAPKGGIED
jgi:hypothetical protein